MGWASGGEVFDPICTVIIEAVRDGDMTPATATQVLTVIIDKLQERGWDTEPESLGEFIEYPYVVKAFANNFVEAEENE